MNENDLCCNSENCILKEQCKRYIKGLEAKQNKERVSWLSLYDKDLWISVNIYNKCKWFINNI